MFLMRSVLLLTLALLVASCASITKVSGPASTASQALNQQHLKSLSTIQQFTLKGRIGVQTDGKGFSGNLHWQHDHTIDNIAIYSPLGGQVASISKTADKVVLEDARGNRISAADAETLTQNALGWKLPLAGLADWSLGRPTRSANHDSTWDNQGKLTSLKQDDWEIEYQNYVENNGIFLPSKILLKSQKVNLKLLVEQWDLPTNH